MTIKEAFAEKERLGAERDALWEQHKAECSKSIHAFCDRSFPDNFLVRREAWPETVSAVLDEPTGKYYHFSICVLAMPAEMYAQAREANWLAEEDLAAADWLVEGYSY